jgi:general stress protein YciG
MTDNNETPEPKPKARRGPKPGSAAALRVGFAGDPERDRQAGLIGGARVRELYGSEHYRQIGLAGGRKLVETRGKEHFAAIGKTGGTHKATNAFKRKHGASSG